MMNNLLFDEETHTYTQNGIVLPSVTEILQFLSVSTHDNANPILRQQAADRGTRIHEATILYDFLGFDADVIDFDIWKYIHAYGDFVRDYRIKRYLLTEEAIANGEYAGTLDRLAIIDGELTIIDFKTGTTVDPRKEAAQLYAYAKLLADNRFNGIDSWKSFKGIIVRLKKDGTYAVQKRDLEKGQRFFCKCKELYDMIKEDKEKHGTRNS